MRKSYFQTVFLLIISLQTFAQSNYTVASIPFQPYSGSLPVLSTSDDMCSGLINLPFSFDFYGTVYNQFVVSTNGYIDFRSTSANSFSPWSINMTIPNASFPVKNAILGCYHDMNNSDAQGTVNYGVYGTAPYRKFIVSFYNNSHFSCNATAKSSFQMILHETSNLIDVQLINKQICSSWNNGNAVIGLINSTGTLGIAAPGRNTGAWTTLNEGWRFSRPGYLNVYSFVKCDANTNGVEEFNLQVVQNDLSPSNPSAITLYLTQADAQAQVNPISSLMYTNISNPQTIYASGNGVIKQVILSAIDCSIDNDNDTVSTDLEDANNDTNLANDDTDADGIPNYLDNDDDGDYVLTSLEYVFNRSATTTILDTDSDSIPNYLDNDDDGDGVLTYLEDYNDDGDPSNDDTNSNGTPDYLEFAVALGLEGNSINNVINLFPNPTSEVLNIDNKTNEIVSNVSIYSISGALIKEVKSTNSIESISVSDLQTGIYFVKLSINDEVKNYKFIKK
ncbi:MAG: T9SS type A sorting domain-containing protein [Flavobacterium sp.]